jgi:hypothetical protein
MKGYKPVEYDPLWFLSSCPPERNEKFPAQSTKVNASGGIQTRRSECISFILIKIIPDHATRDRSPLGILIYFEKILYQFLAMGLSTH